MTAELKSAISSGFWGVFLFFGGFWLWHSFVGNPFDHLALINRARTAQGFIVETSEDAEDSDAEGTIWFHNSTYKFRLPDGREFVRQQSGSGRLKDEFRDLTQPFPVEIEYLPENPDVSRIKGDGSDTIWDWIWRKVGLGGALLVLFLTPGFNLLRSAVRNFIRENRARRALRALKAEALFSEGKKLHTEKAGMTAGNVAAFELFNRAALAGHAEAQLLVYRCFNSGDGIEKDQREAVHWLQSAANRNSVRACIVLGLYHLYGRGPLPINEAEGLRWMERAVELECFGAALALQSYWDERNNATESFKWMKRAADFGYDDSIYAVAHHYAARDILPQDYVEVYQWWSLYRRCFFLRDAQWTPSQGGLAPSELIAQKLRSVAARMTPDEIKNGDERIAQFVKHAPHWPWGDKPPRNE